MKKLITLILILSFSLLTTSCKIKEQSTDKSNEEEKEIQEYTGKKITKFKCISVDFNGGVTDMEVLDFNQNNYAFARHLPYDTVDIESKLEIKCTFTDEQEKALIDHCYTYGLFDIKEHYTATEHIIDGGSWSFIIEYEDGTTKTSTGTNASPSKVFSDCATAFYDICRSGVVGYVKSDYYTPPKISYSLRNYDGVSTISNGLNTKRVDYRWNGFESIGNNVYDINQSMKFTTPIYAYYEYELSLYTANYNAVHDYEKFNNCIVTSYDYNENLTNQTVEYKTSWFKQTKIKLKSNKIYVVKLEFKDGDFVEYTFNTRITN